MLIPTKFLLSPESESTLWTFPMSVLSGFRLPYVVDFPGGASHCLDGCSAGFCRFPQNFMLECCGDATENKKSRNFRFRISAVRTGLEPATPCVTGMYSNQLNYRTIDSCFCVSDCKGTTSF